MNEITITVKSGLIQDIENIPENIKVIVKDYDTDGSDPDRLQKDEQGEHSISWYESSGINKNILDQIMDTVLYDTQFTFEDIYNNCMESEEQERFDSLTDVEKKMFLEKNILTLSSLVENAIMTEWDWAITSNLELDWNLSTCNHIELRSEVEQNNLELCNLVPKGKTNEVPERWTIGIEDWIGDLPGFHYDSKTEYEQDVAILPELNKQLNKQFQPDGKTCQHAENEDCIHCVDCGECREDLDSNDRCIPCGGVEEQALHPEALR